MAGHDNNERIGDQAEEFLRRNRGQQPNEKAQREQRWKARRQDLETLLDDTVVTVRDGLQETAEVVEKRANEVLNDINQRVDATLTAFSEIWRRNKK